MTQLPLTPHVAVLFALLAGPTRTQQFQEQPGLIPGTARWTEGAECADVDADGDLDLFFADGEGFAFPGAKRQNVLLINQLVETGSLSFTDESVGRLGVHLSNAKNVVTADVDGDGWVDALFTNAFNTDVPFLYMNQGGSGSPGFFTMESAARGFTTPYSSAGAQFADLDDDGDLDLILTDSGPNFLSGPGGRPHLFENDGNGFFTENAAALPAPTKISHMDVQIADVDNDWDLDFVGFNRDSNGGDPHYLMLNDGTGAFTDVSSLVPGTSGFTYEGEVADLDGDDDIDFFLVSLSGFSEGHIRNDYAPSGPLSFTQGSGLPGGSDDNEIVLLDYDVDGDLDVFVGSLGPRERIYRNDGGLTWTVADAEIEGISDSTLDATAADLDNDGRYDFITAQGESNQGQWRNKVYLNNGPTDTLAPRIVDLRDPVASSPTGPFVAHAKVSDQVVDDGRDWLSARGSSIVRGAEIHQAIDIQSGGFVPSFAVVAPGTTVTWTNGSNVSQSVASTTAPYGYDSGPIAPGGEYARTFVTPGIYNYASSTGATGQIAVQSGASSSTGLLAGGGLYRFALPDDAGGSGESICYELFFTDFAGNVSVSESSCVPILDCEPVPYCTAKTNSCGGLPAISWTGVPSASATSGFAVEASGARHGKIGLVLYTDAGRAALPFQGGLLCVAPQGLKRGPPVVAGGGGGSCDARFAIDWNAFAAGLAGGQPATYLRQVGQQVNLQWWGRDSFAAGSFLSNGLEYTTCP